MVFLYLTLMEYHNLAIIMSEEIEYLWEVSSTLLQKLKLIHALVWLGTLFFLKSFMWNKFEMSLYHMNYIVLIV